MSRAALEDLVLVRSRPRLAVLWLDMLLDDRLLEADLDRRELDERDGLELPEDMILELLVPVLSGPLGLGLW